MGQAGEYFGQKMGMGKKAPPALILRHQPDHINVQNTVTDCKYRQNPALLIVYNTITLNRESVSQSQPTALALAKNAKRCPTSLLK